MSINIPFKSYCWSLGTTSFRTKNFNITIEEQLGYLDAFWNDGQYVGKAWRDVQSQYYEFLKKNNFLSGDAEREDKDARQKTSGLVDIGLIDSERRLTPAGRALLQISKTKDFKPDNVLELEKDSFIYLKQLLKTTNLVDGEAVRPFIVLAYILSKCGYLTYDEFTYCVPLCTGRLSTSQMICDIAKLRAGKTTVDDIIYNKLMSMNNYRTAREYLLANEPSEEVILTVGMNRKSRTGGANYDKAYYTAYCLLKQVVLDSRHDLVMELFSSLNTIKNAPSGMWKKHLFKTTSVKAIRRDGIAAMRNSDLLQAGDETELRKLFFKYLHLFKVKTNLHDYFDLNRRYFKCTDTLVFADNKVEFDIMPKVYFSQISEELIEHGFGYEHRLGENISLEKISPCLKVDTKRLYAALSVTVGKTVGSAGQAKEIIRNERYVRLQNLIRSKFSREQISQLLTLFEERKDSEIRKLVTDNADIPTIFEYVLGIAWYVISEQEGDILDYMKLSFEADLLPKSHAVGGDADIVYEYSATPDYPEHTLLIEATLAEKNNQRRMEMEPVSRHLGDYLIANPLTNAYCVFATTCLHINVVSDFRNRKNAEYFSLDGAKSIDAMKIIPLQTSEIKRVLDSQITYSMLYPMFEKAYRSDVKVKDWYEETIIASLV